MFTAGSLFAACGNGNNQSTGADTSLVDTTKKEATQDNDAKFKHDSVMKEDADAVVDAYSGGLFEKSVADQASEKAMADDVKNFAKQLSADHGQLNDQLTSTATNYNITLPSGLSEKQTKELNKMGEKAGADYDKAFVNHMINGHKDAIKMFQKDSADCKNSDIRNLFASALPKLNEHLNMATELKHKMKK